MWISNRNRLKILKLNGGHEEILCPRKNSSAAKGLMSYCGGLIRSTLGLIGPAGWALGDLALFSSLLAVRRVVMWLLVERSKDQYQSGFP